MNEGKMIRNLMVFFVLIVGGVLYAANNPHKAFNINKFGEDTQYLHKETVDLASSVEKNRELLNKLSDQIKELNTFLERLNSDYKLSTAALRDEFLASANILEAQKIRSDLLSQEVIQLQNIVDENNTRDVAQEEQLNAAGALVDILADNQADLRTKLNIDTAAQNAVVTNSQLDIDY